MMSADQYREHIEQLGMTQRSAAVFLGVSERSSRRFAAGDEVPRAIELLLRVMVEHGVTPDDAFRLSHYKLPKKGWGDARFVAEE